MSDKVKAKVIWYSRLKGFGFVKPEEGEDVMVHQSSIDMEGFRFLKPNQEVLLVGIESTARGLRANKVELTN